MSDDDRQPMPDEININDWPSQEWLDVVANSGGLKVTAKDGQVYRVLVERDTGGGAD